MQEMLKSSAKSSVAAIGRQNVQAVYARYNHSESIRETMNAMREQKAAQGHILRGETDGNERYALLPSKNHAVLHRLELPQACILSRWDKSDMPTAA
jgi:hypothetical protein